MSTVWFTADTHFNHDSMITKGWRPQFNSVPEMNEAMVENWNAVVTKRDVVWHLGDVGMGSATQFLSIVARLNGTINLITGNHDQVWSALREAHSHQRSWLDAGFSSIQPYAIRKVGGRHVALSHFPYEGDRTAEARFDAWRLRDVGLPLLHGHVHGAWKIRDRQINVGVDVRGFAPVSVDEIAAEMAGWD